MKGAHACAQSAQLGSAMILTLVFFCIIGGLGKNGQLVRFRFDRLVHPTTRAERRAALPIGGGV